MVSVVPGCLPGAVGPGEGEQLQEDEGHPGEADREVCHQFRASQTRAAPAEEHGCPHCRTGVTTDPPREGSMLAEWEDFLLWNLTVHMIMLQLFSPHQLSPLLCFKLKLIVSFPPFPNQ